MTDKPSRQIDTPIKLCYSCDSKAIIIIQKNITVQTVVCVKQQQG